MTELLFHWIHQFDVNFKSWGFFASLIFGFVMIWLLPVILIGALLLALPLITSLVITLFIAAFDQTKESFIDVFVNRVADIFYLCSDIMVPIILFICLIMYFYSKQPLNKSKKSSRRSQSYQKRNPRKKSSKRKIK